MAEIVVKLTPAEVLTGAHVGIMRQVQNLSKGRRQANNHDPACDWRDHIEGALGEMAVAKWLNRYWSGRLGNLGAADVGNVEVRTSTHDEACLILHGKDPDERVFVLVTGCNGEYVIRGWMFGVEGKRGRYWREPVRGRGAYFVPAYELSNPESVHEGA